MSEYKQLIIYYFSGTGNAKNVASWIADLATEKNTYTELIDISKIERKHIPQPPSNALIGLCSPTHGFNFPPVMMNFIFRFPKASNNNKVFIIISVFDSYNVIHVPHGDFLSIKGCDFIKGQTIARKVPIFFQIIMVKINPFPDKSGRCFWFEITFGNIPH